VSQEAQVSIDRRDSFKIEGPSFFFIRQGDSPIKPHFRLDFPAWSGKLGLFPVFAGGAEKTVRSVVTKVVLDELNK
jgi:hypothetical protein